MNARLTMCQAQPGKTKDVLKIFHDSIFPAMKLQKGFKRMFLLTKSNSDQVVWFSFWANETSLKALDTVGFFKDQINKLNDLLTGPPFTDMYQVAAEGKSKRLDFMRPRSYTPRAS